MLLGLPELYNHTCVCDYCTLSWCMCVINHTSRSLSNEEALKSVISLYMRKENMQFREHIHSFTQALKMTFHELRCGDMHKRGHVFACITEITLAQFENILNKAGGCSTTEARYRI